MVAHRTIDELLAAARRELTAAAVRPAGREARLLLGQVLGLGEAQLVARGNEPVPEVEATRFTKLLARRRRGEPVAYLRGEREFYGRPFRVDHRVLIPRPETEHLVAAVLALDLPSAPSILDLGTGSGCIAVTLALELPRSRVVATDVSLPALTVAAANVDRHHVGDRVRLVRADLAAPLRLDRVDLVASNPPYVDPGVPELVAPAVRDFEPHLAFFAADRGRAVLKRLLAAAPALRPGGRLVLEIGWGQDRWLRAAVDAAVDLELVEIVNDYAGIPRTAVIRRT